MKSRLFLLAALLASVAGCEPTAPAGPSDPAKDTYAASLNVDIPSMVKLYSGDLYYKDIVVGTGSGVTTGKTVLVEYTGYLTNGTQFDSNVGKDPLQVTLVDDGSFLTGFVFGILGGGGGAGMKPGGQRKIVIGSAFGYGAAGNGAIKPNTTIVFDITLKSVK